MNKSKEYLKRSSIFLIFTFAISIFVTGCGKMSEKEIARHKDEIRNYIKSTMNVSWTYDDSKVEISDDFITTLVLYNVEDFVDCYDASIPFAKDLNKSYKDEIKINSLTFACKINSESSTNGYVEIKNIQNIDFNNYEKYVKVFNGNKELINTSVENYREEFKNDFIKKCNTYEYKEIFRNAKKYVNKYAKFTGEVIQVSDSNNYYWIRLNVTKDEFGLYEDTIMVGMPIYLFEGRILENDIITIYGRLNELTRYESIFGEEITIPSITAKYVELVE